MSKKIFVQALNLDDVELFLIKSKLQDACPEATIIVVQSEFEPKSILSDLKESIVDTLEDNRILGSIDKYQAAESLVSKFTNLLLYSSQPILKHKKLKKQKLKLNKNKNKHGNN